MATTTTKKGTKRTGTKAKQAGTKAKRTGTQAKRAGAKARPPDPSKQTPAANAAVAKTAAIAGTKAAGRAVAVAAERVKTPLIVGGAATAGVIGGLIVHRRSSRSGRNGFSRIHLPLRDGKLDLSTIAAAAHKAGELGQQANELGTALDRVQRGK
jgi:hypothetical protein